VDRADHALGRIDLDRDALGAVHLIGQPVAGGNRRSRSGT
jgi:hypothetical protein